LGVPEWTLGVSQADFGSFLSELWEFFLTDFGSSAADLGSSAADFGSSQPTMGVSC